MQREFTSLLIQIVNEFDISFKLDVEYVNKLYRKIAKCSKDSIVCETTMKSFVDSVTPHADKMFIKHHRKQDFMWMNDIVFLDILPMSVFVKENRQTKRDILAYLVKLYAICIGDFTIPSISEPASSTLSGLMSIQDPLAFTESAPDIMKLAKELSSDIKLDSFNPANLMSFLTTGEMNENMTNLMNDIAQKLEIKMTEQGIDKDVLERQAIDIMKHFNKK